MKKKLISTLFISILTLFCAQADASKLPDNVWKYVKSQLPSAQQRFDSVITVGDIMYIPLYPPTDKKVDTLKVDYTYPANKSLKDRPEVILFNNDFSLLKVFKDSKGDYTLTTKDDLPIRVRLGLMPQDMLTPVGLKMPESLKLTLGDLLIPSREDTSLVLKDNEKAAAKNPYAPTVKRNEFIQTAELKNKKTLINPKNSKFLEVYNSTSQNALYELKLSAMPSKIVVSDKSRVALVLYWANNSVDIINVADETIVSKIDIGAPATDVALSEKNNIAYVTVQNSGAIYVINLNTMQLDKIIKLDQKPSKIVYCDIDDSIAFYDEFTSQVFIVTQNNGDYIVQPVAGVENASKLYMDVANIYATSRTKSELYILDKVEAKLINTITLDKKPTDAVVYKNKLYILCSKEAYIDVFDMIEGKLVSREQISKDGFYSKITPIPNEKNIIITGNSSKDYVIYNLDLMKPTKKQESYIDVANIVILDTAERL